MMNNRHSLEAVTFNIWRICGWSGLIYLVGSLLGWAVIAGFIPPPQSDWSPERMAEFYRENNSAIKAGLVITLNFQLFYVFFSIALARLIEEIEGPRGMLSRLELYCGFTNFIITIAGLFFWLSATFKAEVSTVESIFLSNNMGWMWIETMFVATMMQYVFVGVAAMMDRRKTPLFPKWFPWFSFAAAASMWPVSLIPFLYSGPFAYHGLISLYFVYFMYFAWIGVASYFAGKAINRIGMPA